MEPVFLVPQMIEEIDQITKRTCADLLERDINNPIGQELRNSLKSQTDLAILGIALRKRQMRRMTRQEEKDINKRYNDLVTWLYGQGYFLKGSNAFDGGGALPLSKRSAKNLAMKFFDIFHETDVPINILLVRVKHGTLNIALVCSTLINFIRLEVAIARRQYALLHILRNMDTVPIRSWFIVWK